MALTKSRTQLWASNTLTAGGADQTTAWQDIRGAYDTAVNVVITNGATGPTDPAEVIVEVANDYNSGSPNQPTEFRFYAAGTASGESYDFPVVLPTATQAFRLIAGRNTDQDVTIDADYSEVTGL